MVKVTLALCLAVFLSVVGYFIYLQFVNSKNVPQEVVSSPDYQIALAQAERLRIEALFLAPVVFLIAVFALSHYRLPRTSWLRTILAIAITFLPVFVVFSKLMEADFQRTFPGAPLPLSALLTITEFALGGIFMIGFVFFVTERIRVWRVAR